MNADSQEDPVDRTRRTFRQYYPRLVSMVYALGASSEEADECASSALASLSARTPYPHNPGAYVFSACRKQYVSLLRKKERRHALLRAHDLGVSLGDDLSPARFELVVEAILILLQSQSEAANEQDQIHGQAILLWLAGYSPGEISERLGKPQKTIYHWLEHGFSDRQVDRIRSSAPHEDIASLADALAARLQQTLDRKAG